MEQSPSRGGNSHSAIQEIPAFYRNLKVKFSYKEIWIKVH